jgi:hypothetical protein
MTGFNPLLEISGDKADGGGLVGRKPDEITPEALSLNFWAKNPLRAIRAKCIDCCCGNAAEVRKCVATDCALWPFRLSANPFRKRGVLSEDERLSRVARLGRASEKSMV